MAENPDDQDELVARRGRRSGNPGEKRSYRYVMRMHPDLAEVLGLLADEAQMSRALFVERILLSFVNQDPRVNLDPNGRKIGPGRPRHQPQPGSLAAFSQKWSRWQSLREGVFGDDLPDPYGDQYIDDYGRDEQGRPVHQPLARPMRPPGSPPAIPRNNIRTNRGKKGPRE
jgi:hypothetical protein